MINLSSRNPILRFKFFKKGGLIRKFQEAGKFDPRLMLLDPKVNEERKFKIVYPDWRDVVPQTVWTGHGFQNGNDTIDEQLPTYVAKPKTGKSTKTKNKNRTRGTASTATRTKPITQTYTVPEGIDDIKKAQLMLLEGGFYDLNYLNRKPNVTDGIWGQYTDAAYKKWLDKLNESLASNIASTSSEPLDVVIPTKTTPYLSTYNYGIGNDIKNLGFNNYNGLVNFVKSNPDNLFAKDLTERFNDVNTWNQADVEGALGVSGLYRRGLYGDYSDMARSMRDWATKKNEESLVNNTSESTPYWKYASKFFNTYNPGLFGVQNPSNLFSTYNNSGIIFPSNPILRFKFFKKGGMIKKFQNAGNLVYPKWEDVAPQTVWTGYGFQNGNDTSINLPTVTVSADYKLIIRDKASKRNSVIANLLNGLWKAGAFKGVKDKNGKEATYKSAVDGIEGNMTKAAIENALKMGYNVDTEAGTVLKKGSVKIPKQLTRNGLANMYSMTHTAATGGMNTVPSNISENTGIFGNYILNNMYPYSYGDVLQKGDEVIPYDGGEIPEGWKLRQATAKDPATVLAKAFLLKIRSAMKNVDPRRTFIDELAKIDLSTPEGKKKYLEMVKKAPQGVVRINGNPENDLFEIKARLDLANRYANDNINLSEWEENPDFSSPTAKARGKKTYRIKDPKLRERIYGEMINYFLQNKQKGHWNDTHTAFILPSMGFLGNHSMVADDENGLNLRYGDWWDYSPNTSGGNITYIGDRLVPEGAYPKATKYGIGHNHDEMTEMADHLIAEVIKEKLGLNKK